MNSIITNNYIYKAEDTDNILFILYNEVLFLFDGEKWGQIYISDINLPGTDFGLLKKPGLVEISNLNDEHSIKTFLVTGGFIPNSQTFAKTVYILNFKINVQKDENTGKDNIFYDCLLDFKYGDMKSGRFLHSSINIQNKYVLVIGGKNEKGWLNSCEILDLTTGEWKDFPSMNSPRANFDSLLFEKNNKLFIYCYGGYSDVGKFAELLIEVCEIDLNDIFKSKWQNVKYSFDFDSSNNNSNNIPKICARIINYDENFIIVGGSDGKHLLSDVYEFDTSSNEINKVGELKTPRNNFHYLLKGGDIIIVGGSCKKFTGYDEILENYSEKLTFNLANQIESENISTAKDIFLSTIKNLSINESEFLYEPGFPYSASIISKCFKNK